MCHRRLDQWFRSKVRCKASPDQGLQLVLRQHLGQVSGCGLPLLLMCSGFSGAWLGITRGLHIVVQQAPYHRF
jgi:hypothetical protein